VKVSPIVTLGDVVEVKGGGTPSKANPAFWNGDIPWVSPKDMKSWNIEDAEDKITSEAIKGSATNLIPQNSILIVNRSGILKHTLPVGITRRPVAINQDLKALICGPRSHPEYIARLVKAAEPLILKWVRATTADNFPIENLRSLEIPLPPLDEQRRIAAILDKADDLRRKRKRALDLLDSLTQSIFLEMFGKELFSSSHLREIGDIAKLQNGAYYPADQYSDSQDGVEMVHMSDAFYGMVNRGRLKRIKCGIPDIQKYSLLPSDLIVARRSLTIEGAAKPCLIPDSQEPLIYESSFIRVRADTNVINASYLYHYLSHPFLRKKHLNPYITQSTISGINQANLSKVKIYVPPMTEQEKFVFVSSHVKQQQGKMLAALNQSDLLFSSLQHRVFSGQL
jgi:type I restriction enzyme S subunit